MSSHRFLSTCLFTLVIAGLFLVPFSGRTVDANRTSDWINQDTLSLRFAPAKRLLEEKEVPFEPERLFDDNWRETLASELDSMPEMQKSVKLEDRIRGVKVADTIYFPNRTALTGDTVILARNIVFEGRDAILKGPYNVYYFPIEKSGTLGMSLKQAVERQLGSLSATERYDDPAVLRRFRPNLLRRDWSVTIDTSGFGSVHWHS